MFLIEFLPNINVFLLSVGITHNTPRKITNEDIAAQAIVFFTAGSDTVASMMSFLSYELATNPDAQEKLRKEIVENSEKCKGKITYEALLKMKYMDMVISETLRKWPNVLATDRVCTKPYTIKPAVPGEKPVHLEKGTALFLPTFSIHRDPRYFPHPERFDPERFNDENKKNINPYTYFPFGVGPRTCIGSRFALLETKVVFFHLLSHFKLVPIERTMIPIQISRKSLSVSFDNGLWIGLKRCRE
ncbi:hypothetical protein NQ318_019136 [Aromia moschata]|uniref:Cytochrome P450 n=1 Tax=Aromia moschata TaxID=1265417 RepID=A0AAV8YSU0_9CUCU|nr:hypothetical protein NQ318_019136 [Aromia moschata]